MRVASEFLHVCVSISLFLRKHAVEKELTFLPLLTENAQFFFQNNIWFWGGWGGAERNPGAEHLNSNGQQSRTHDSLLCLAGPTKSALCHFPASGSE